MRTNLSTDPTQDPLLQEEARRRERKERANRANPDTPSPQEGTTVNDEDPDPDT